MARDFIIQYTDGYLTKEIDSVIVKADSMDQALDQVRLLFPDAMLISVGRIHYVEDLL